jgi:HK97 gp10 family phage protein
MANLYKLSVSITYNHFPKIAKGLEQGALDVVAETVLALVAMADPLTPVDTGNLKNNKVINTGGADGKGFVHWQAPYAGFVNYGTRYMAARPFIDSSVAQVMPMFIKAMDELTKRGG